MIDEGYTKFAVDWTRSGPLEDPRIGELCRWRQALFEAGLIGYYDHLGVGFGNLSVRSGDGPAFIISGSQTGHVAIVDGAHFAVVTDFDVDANRVTCRGPVQASSESMTHAAIYASLVMVNAVVHVHSNELWVRSKGILPTTREDVSYGTPAMAREMSRLCLETDFSERGIAVMAGHESGMVSIGGDLEQAARRILELNAESL